VRGHRRDLRFGELGHPEFCGQSLDPEGCKFSVAAVARHNPTTDDEAMVVRTLVFMVVRRVLGLVGLAPSPDAN
jgi:hypothetical protein